MTNHIASAPDAPHAPHALTDHELLGRLPHLVARERGATALLIAHLAELDARRLYLGAGCASTHAYCVTVLHLSEHAAYLRIEAARLARRFPILLDELASGRLHLTGLARLGPHLTAGNLAGSLEAVRHRSRREIEDYVERIRTTPPRTAPARMELRAVPGWAPGQGATAKGAAPRNTPSKDSTTNDTPAREAADHDAAPKGPPSSAEAALLAGPAPGLPQGCGLFAGSLEPDSARSTVAATAAVPVAAPGFPAAVALAGAASTSETAYRLHVTIRAETRAKLERARALLGHTRQTDDVADVLDRALDLLVERLEARKWASTKRPTKLVGKRPSVERAAASAPSASAAAAPTVPAASTPTLPAASGSAVTVAPAPYPMTAPGRPARVTRSIPAAVRRAVRERDGERCAFVAPDGRRCAATTRLEFHHVVPWARGGPATLANMELRCRAHNQYQAVRDFGGSLRAAGAADLARREALGSRPARRSAPPGNDAPRRAGPGSLNSVRTEFAPGQPRPG